MKFNKCKCSHLQCLEQKNPRHQQLESSFAERDTRALVENKLTMSQQCTPVSKAASSLLGCTSMRVQGTKSSRQFGSCETVSGVLCPVLCSPVREGHGHTGLREKRDSVGWNPSHFLCPESQCGIQVPIMFFHKSYLVLFKEGFLAVRVWAF